MYGEVIGITNAKYSSKSGNSASIDNIGFAIPISRVFSIVESIMKDGVIAKPYIGVTVSDVSAEALAYGLPKGAAVRSITENSPAEDAGLQENDIITAFDGKEITGRKDLSSAVTSSSVGSEHTLTVYRQGQTVEVTVEIGKSEQTSLPEKKETQDQYGQRPQFPEIFDGYFQQYGNSQFP